MLVFDVDLNYVGRLNDRGQPVLRRKFTYMRWPMSVGAQWEAEGRYEFLQGGAWMARTMKIFYQVRAAEEVATPAGSFRCLRLYSIWRWFSQSGSPLGHEEDEDLFCREARFYVKGRFKEGTYSSEYELVEMALTP
jgi:hypothetical protein